MNPHLAELISRHPALAECASSIEVAFGILRTSFAAGGRLLLCGNGGSAADADHWSAELLKGFTLKRDPDPDSARRLGEPYASSLQRGLPCIPLSQFAALTTAWANDVDSELVWAQLVYTLGRPGDVLVGISTSGNSRNVLHGARVARRMGMRVIALTGRSGGRLAPEVDCAIRVPADVTHHIQELHLPVYHALSIMLEHEFFGPQAG
jgi:D-sedoheptulose 7-phosphate isomerase